MGLGTAYPLDQRSVPPSVDLNAMMWLDVAMKRVKIAELKDHLSKHLRAVERGDEVEVTDRGRPIARIVPVDVRARITRARRSFASVSRRRYRPARWPADSLELLLEERSET